MEKKKTQSYDTTKRNLYVNYFLYILWIPGTYVLILCFREGMKLLHHHCHKYSVTISEVKGKKWTVAAEVTFGCILTWQVQHMQNATFARHYYFILFHKKSIIFPFQMNQCGLGVVGASVRIWISTQSGWLTQWLKNTLWWATHINLSQ